MLNVKKQELGIQSRENRKQATQKLELLIAVFLLNWKLKAGLIAFKRRKPCSIVSLKKMLEKSECSRKAQKTSSKKFTLKTHAYKNYLELRLRSNENINQQSLQRTIRINSFSWFSVKSGQDLTR